MVTIRVCSKLKTSWKSVIFTNKVGKNSKYFVAVFNKTIIPLALVEYEMIIANSALRASFAIFYLTLQSSTERDSITTVYSSTWLKKFIL